ncbi:MAG TPA: hypothetical protein PLP64_01295 [Pseudothermotoga sp.]|nr:hypothetical protein [Pseudothermotoga sp.]HOK82844.1 hypothetical protein [Pseudothermotoga sp.]HPP69983.1 hypothetical protein [Pseudothermotoga sp.]
MIIHVALLERDLLLTPHAYQRMLERGIEVNELSRLLESKDAQAIIQHNGRISISNGIITAILQLSGHVLYLVTVLRE